MVTNAKISPKMVNPTDIAGECRRRRSLRFTILGEIFAYVTIYLDPTTEAVTFHLRGWCMLGAFLLLAFTCLGHERQVLLSPCDGMHGCTHRLDIGLYSHPKILGNGVRTIVNSKGKIPSVKESLCCKCT